MPTRILLAIAAALLLARVPSLAQPMGPDQGLYAYVGDRILAGELAYRDAWDQKPPGIHYVYAVLRAISTRDVVVPAADLAAAAGVATLLWFLGRRLDSAAAGGLSAVLFLLLSDPSIDRYGGVRVRAQAETFIALSIAAAVAAALAGTRARWRQFLVAGLFVGAAFTLKYNAGLYGVVVLAAAGLAGRLNRQTVVATVLGALLLPLVALAVFAYGGALHDLYQATVVYNLRYSSETYATRLDTLRYLVLFPLQHARLSALWFVGGLGCLTLLVLGRRSRLLWLPVVWVAAACVSIAINGSRELPQYFVQAAPALALAAGVAGMAALRSAPVAVRWIVAVLVAYGCWRAGSQPFPAKIALTARQDAAALAQRVDRRAYLGRFGGRDTDKYSALDNVEIGAFLASRTTPDERVYVFGYSPGAYAYARRRSASRFFWSRPVILDFNAGDPHYGVEGLRDDLDRSRPAYVILQQHDWAPDVQDSAPFFLAQPPLAEWLHAGYHEVHPFVDGFSAWERNGR